MSPKSVILGYSGGIDSCTAVEILRAEGYRVVALTIDTIGDKTMLDAARRSAEQLGVEWLSYDARELFRHEIIEYFRDEYLAGHTPAPCTRCNTLVKWRTLLDEADKLGIEHIATGHYFRIEQHNHRYYVATAGDSTKDQSYYLWGLSQEILQRALTPMGNIIKSEIKGRFVDKSESMGICFLHGMNYGDFLRENGVTMTHGEVLTTSGNVVAQHGGIALYTIGQKRGTGIPSGLRVVDIDSKHNRLVVGSNDDLYKSTLYVGNCNIINREELLNERDITIKIRGIGRNPEQPVRITPYTNGYRIACSDAAWAPAKGQPLVFYRNNLVIGGGIVVDFE